MFYPIRFKGEKGIMFDLNDTINHMIGSIPKEKPKLRKIIGLRNIVTNGNEWKYLLLYDKDSQDDDVIKEMKECYYGISFLIYKTKHGIHGIGLTPMSIEHYASRFQLLQDIIPEYYSGQTIRVSRKQDEKQELIHYNFNYPILPNLLHIYAKRFFHDKPVSFYEEFQKNLINDHWNLVFEKYWSSKPGQY